MGDSDVIEHKLATFSSPKNPEIEEFIRDKAISFAIEKYKEQKFKEFDESFFTEDIQKYIRFMRFF